MTTHATICYNCARGWCNHDTPNPAATWHIGECGVCRHTLPVTDPRDWGGMKPDWSEPTPHHGETLNGGAVWRLREWERILRENRPEFARRYCAHQDLRHVSWNSERMYYTLEYRGPDSLPLSVWLSFVEGCVARDALGRRDNDR